MTVYEGIFPIQLVNFQAKFLQMQFLPYFYKKYFCVCPFWCKFGSLIIF